MKKIYFCIACFFSSLTAISVAAPVNQGCVEKEKALTLLETAESLLTKARVSFPPCNEDGNTTEGSECSRRKPLAYIEISKELISDVRRNFPTCSKPIEKDDKVVQDDKFSDCSEILASGQNKSGIYKIWTEESFTTGKPLQVYCDMETDKGGWTMIQRRGKFPYQEDFYRDWETYKNGFGYINEEFWLGNENIRVLCQGGCKIRFDLQAEDGEKRYQVYKNFSLSTGNYRLHIEGDEGNAGDCMKDLTEFSTYHQGPAKNKAMEEKGGWWYDQVPMSNLNGIYKPGESSIECVYWYKFQKLVNLASVEIKVRPN